MEIYKKNIRFLSEHFPAVLPGILPPDEIKTCTYRDSPNPNILVNGRPLHSSDPVREARSLARSVGLRKGVLVIFLGIGTGIQIEEFRRVHGRNADEALVVVIEPSAESFSLLLHHRDVSFLRGARLLLGRASEEVIEYFESLDPLSFRGHGIVKLRGAHSVFGDYFGRIETGFRHLMSARLSDLLTRFAFENLWMKNIIENVVFLAGRRSVSGLRDALSGKPALVVNAGPGLLDELDTIERIAGGVHLFAVDTAIEPLLARGIVPDVVVTLDAQFHNLLDFTRLFCSNGSGGSVLAADITVCPGILSHWRGPLLFSRTLLESGERREHHGLTDLLGTFHPDIHSLRCGGSVSTTALELALYTGARPVIAAGLDLGYTDFKTHVNSSPHYNLYLNGSLRLNTLETAMARALKARKLFRVPSRSGGTVLSDFIFGSYIEWIAARSEYGGKVFVLSGKGAAVETLQTVDPSELEKKFAGKAKTPVSKLMDGSSGSAFTREDARGFLRALKEALERAGQDLPESGDGVPSFTARYPFLRESALETRLLYPDPGLLKSHLALLVGFLRERAERSLRKLDR